MHTALPAWHFEAPAQAYAVPDEEWEARVDLTADECVITDPAAPGGYWFFAKGILDIPVHGADEPFSWGVWLSLSQQSFDRYMSLFEDEERTAGESFFGWLCNAVPGYLDTQSLRARLHIQPYPTRPRVELEPTSHPLAADQRDGIPLERAIAAAQTLLHPDAEE